MNRHEAGELCKELYDRYDMRDLTREEFRSILIHAPLEEIDLLKKTAIEQETKRVLRNGSLKGRLERRPGTSCLPFPPLSSPTFGLIQEELAHDPFKLLTAVTFLNRTRGVHAIPVFYDLMNQYPSPESLAAADLSMVSKTIRHLGLQNTRAQRYVQLAAAWVLDPPTRGRRHRKLHYPSRGEGRDIRPGEVVDDETDDARTGAWEVAHLPTTGPYAIDSWRIFCRDRLRGLATGWNGEGARTLGFEPEWKRVLPQDKELRAYLQWMWLKDGWDWNPLTGEKIKLDEQNIYREQNWYHPLGRHD